MGQRSVTEWAVVCVVLVVLLALGGRALLAWSFPEEAPSPDLAADEIRERPEAPPPPTEPPPPPPGDAVEVECNLTQMVGHVQLVEVQGDEVLGPVAVTAVRDWIRFRPRRDAGVGWLYVDGYAPTPMAWIDGACLEQVELARPPMGTVVATVDGELVAGVDYTLTGGMYRAVRFTADEPDEPRLELAAGTEHEVQLTASFGVHMLTGEAVTVTVHEGAEARVAVQAPDIPPLGWSLQPVSAGWKVAWVQPDAPIAAELEVGDVVVAVDDEPVEELDLDDVLWDDEPLTLTVRPYTDDGPADEVEVRLQPAP